MHRQHIIHISGIRYGDEDSYKCICTLLLFSAYQGCYNSEDIPSNESSYTAVSGHNLFGCVQYCKGLEMEFAAYGATTCQCLSAVQG